MCHQLPSAGDTIESRNITRITLDIPKWIPYEDNANDRKSPIVCEDSSDLSDGAPQCLKAYVLFSWVYLVAARHAHPIG